MHLCTGGACEIAFLSEKYVRFHLPWMALTNESALSFLMPGVPFSPLPPVTIHPVTPTGIGLKKKKKPKTQKGHGWNPLVSPHRFSLHYTMQKMTQGEVLSVPLEFSGASGSIWIDTQRQWSG